MKVIKFLTSALMVQAVASFTGCIAEQDAQRAPSVGERNGELVEGTTKQPHCVTASVVQAEGKTTPADVGVAPAPVQCFGSFSEAILAATGGRVQLPPSATAETVDNQTLNGGAVTPFATFVIGIEYEHANFQGATLTITSSVTCVGFNHSISSMPSGWNDVISSARAFSSCNNSIHFEDVNFGGASVNCGTACSFIGAAMNDRTSSIRWTN